jgi:heavy metal translocating P-type ATPase
MKQVLRRFFGFVRSYKLFSFAMLAVITAAALQLSKQQPSANSILALASVIALFPLVTRMIKDIRDGTYGVDILAALAIGTSVVLQQYWAAIIVVIMLTGGESLEVFAARRARSELRDLLKRAPQQAHVVRKGKVMDVRASAIIERDKIIIKPGEVVPADAVITEGMGSFDEASLTGESLPQTKQAGDQILSGSINIDGLITAQAIHTAADSQYQQIVRLVEAAADNPAPFARLADRYSIPFTVVSLTIAGVAWVLTKQPIRFLEVIVVATPCPLILATPIALIAGMSRAARDGIIIKTGTALEKLAQAKTFAFDKTGTLTYGTPEFDAVTAFSPFQKQEVVAYAAALEHASNHVLAKAIIGEAERQRLKLPKTKHIREIAGRGLEAHVQGKDIVVGRYSLLAERNVTMPKQFKHTSVMQTATYIAIDGQLAGYITFKDRVRTETKPALAALKQLGIKRTLMVTGDNKATAKAIATELGIKDFVAETLPGDKLRAIEGIKERPLAFVGDGVNDAPVLTAADVGIALGARGSTAASESADVVVMKDDFSYVVRAVSLSKRAFRIATQSIAIGIGLSVVLMLVFSTGRFSPVTGAITQEAVDVIVIFNALRAHQPDRSRTRR